MRIRFSMKWLLAGMVYVAVAAAAIAQGHWSYAAILWMATFFAVTYALTVAIFARGARQIAAAGFAIASLAIVACMRFAPGSLPTSRFVAALASAQAPIPTTVYATPTPVIPAAPGRPPGTYYPAPAPQPSPPIAAQPYYPPGGPVFATYVAPPAVTISYDNGEVAAVRVRAANAIATMAAGVIGGVLAAVGFRRGRQEPDAV
jgi:hypothetical protein